MSALEPGDVHGREWAALILAAATLACAACTPEDGRPIFFGDTNGGSDTDTGGDGDGDGDTSTSTGDGDGDGDGDSEAPTIIELFPAPGSTAVPADTSISVTFSEAMFVDSITSNGSADTCSGAVQVSDDGFSTCVPLATLVGSSAGDTTFMLTPSNPLNSRRAYQIRVSTLATSAAGVALADDYTSAEPFVTRYFHTVVIDGNNDFDNSDEAFQTSNPGFTGYVAWDQEYVYLGMKGSEIANGDPGLFMFAYLGGSPGSSVGVGYQNQQPTLPFDAHWHPRWKGDDSYANMQAFLGSWADAPDPWLEQPDRAHIGDFVELRLSRQSLGAPSLQPIVMGLLRESNNAESTFAAVPSAAFVDGFDPDLGAYFEFDLDGSTLPVEHLAQ